LLVDARDLELAASARFDGLRYPHHVVVVEVEPRDGVVALRLSRLLLDRDSLHVLVELDNAICCGIRYVISEDDCTIDLSMLTQARTEADAMEDIVAEDE